MIEIYLELLLAIRFESEDRTNPDELHFDEATN
jgi:hypothetical protein